MSLLSTKPAVLTMPEFLKALDAFNQKRNNKGLGFITVRLFGDGSGFVLGPDGEQWREFSTYHEAYEYLTTLWKNSKNPDTSSSNATVKK